MQFDWTTFVLEVLNFLVLVWILKRFLYQPVLTVLDSRQARIESEMAQAARLQQEGASLRQQYAERLAQWAEEREQLRQQLQQELGQLRAAGMEKIRQSLADEDGKARVRNAAATASHEAGLIRLAASEAYRNVAAMLRRLASPMLTASIVQLLLEDLAALPEEQRAALRSAAEKLAADGQAEVASAHPLDDGTRQQIARGVSAAAGRSLPVTVSADAALIAGVRVAVGECRLHANLLDELAFFRRQNGRA
ncbi:MAG: F0F1 ATP synthase subunit delta [Candidatus Accumulibacter sp.]|uniref:F0F1 ATP synthase subunit delta n=1 Tax=Accumulibacter sp. TaxID=2053492 RepID=UPI001D4E2870|nr:F0F1 ATP synthase subunit delta [Accumulibacter sp.]MCB1942010.1 F0F1 ATP synthase subunit delta [Accumulibacter sp.]